jgi:DNA-binding response OmpR family regulator
VTRLLLVDDEANLRHTLGYALRQEGYEVLSAEDGEKALAVFRSSRPDVVILDVMLPGIDGIEVCRRIRRESDVPILMLTARDTEVDRIVGLEIGADDHLGKPFSTRELIARIRALVRRSRRAAEPASLAVMRFGSLQVDAPRRRALRDGVEMKLTAKEFDLLVLLMSNPGIVMTRDRIIASVWGQEYGGETRTVDTHVKTLREALGETADRPRWIETVRGVGYRFRERDGAGPAP